jgi:acetyltransferase-like isoleucine patch superfamily enzyme
VAKRIKKMGLSLGKTIGRIIILFDLFGFAVRKRYLGFDQANAFLRRVGKNSIIPLLKQNGAVIGDECDIEVPLIFHNCQDFRNFQIGNDVHIGKNCFFDLKDKIVIGDNAVISMQATFITHTDMSKSGLNKTNPARKGSILIKNDSYVGANVTILMGVTVGKFSMMAAGAVVIQDVHPWVLVGGVPAKMIKQLKGNIV